jgi:hypothetical protein
MLCIRVSFLYLSFFMELLHSLYKVRLEIPGYLILFSLYPPEIPAALIY